MIATAPQMVRVEGVQVQIEDAHSGSPLLCASCALSADDCMMGSVYGRSDTEAQLKRDPITINAQPSHTFRPAEILR
jgi:hypothetical protein